MNAIREVLDVKDKKVTINLPDSFISKRIEVIVIPYEKIESTKDSLVDFFINSPLKNCNIDFERVFDYGRDIDL